MNNVDYRILNLTSDFRSTVLWQKGLVITIMLLFSTLLQAGTAPYKMCFREVTGLPQPDGNGGFTNPRTPPQIDGVIDGDTGWTNAFRYVFDNGTHLPWGAALAIKKGSMIYLGFQVTADQDFNQYDGVAIGLDNGSGGYTFIVIHPLTPGVGASGPLPSNAVAIYQTNSATPPTSWSGGTTVIPAWLTVQATGVLGAPPLSWNLELSIDNSMLPSGFALPSPSVFGLYISLIRTNETVSPSEVTQFTWPPSLPVSQYKFPQVVTPDPGGWGSGTLDSSQTCSGVHFAHSDIVNSINGGPATTEISLTTTKQNTFSVKVHNSSLADAVGVSSTFKIADFGLPAGPDWAPIGTNMFCPSHSDSSPACHAAHANDSVGNNPSATVDIAAHSTPPGTCGDGSGDGCSTISTGPWTLSSDNVNYYTGDDHQCVLVELTSTAGDTMFVNKSTWNNFDLNASASRFVSYPAVISGNYPGGATQSLHLAISRKESTAGQSNAATIPATAAAVSGTAVGGGGDKTIHYLDFTVDGCRHTGTFITIDAPPTFGPDRQLIPGPSKQFESCEPVGAYGYHIRHVGPVKSWNYSLTATGDGVSLTQKGNQFDLTVRQGKKAQVVTTITPAGGNQPPLNHKFAVLADLGAAIPNGTFSNVVNTGFSFNGGLEYIVNSHFSAEGILGVHHFPGKIAGDVTAIQFTGGGRVYLTNSPNRLFVRAGLGGYHFTSATTNFGGYFGAGLLHEFNSHFGLEGVYTFHAVNTPGTATKFSTVQGGVRYVF